MINQLFNHTKDYSFLTIKESYNYVFTTLPINYINAQFLESLRKFITSFLQTIISLVHMLFFISLYLSKFLILVFPHAVKLSKTIYNFHKTQLSTSDLIIEFVSISLILTCLIFKKRIQKLWQSIIKSISNKSKSAAKALPHILYFGTAITFAIIGKKFLIPFTNPTVMPCITLAIPLITTLRSVYYQLDLITLRKTSEIMLLWIILAIYHGIVTCLSYVPFSSKVLTVLPYIKELVLIILVWTQISSIFSKMVFDSIILNILLKISHFIPASTINTTTTAQTNTITSILKMLNIINDQQLSFLKALFQDSVATLIAIGFLFTPTFISNFGIVIISLFLPAIRTATVVVSILAIDKTSTISNSSINNKKNIEDIHNKPIDQVDNPNKDYMHFQWIRYWICIGMLWLLRIYAFKLWPSIMLLLVLWLQHSYFLGASYILNYVSETLHIAIERNQRVQKEYNNKVNENLSITNNNDNQNDIDMICNDIGNNDDNSNSLITKNNISYEDPINNNDDDDGNNHIIINSNQNTPKRKTNKTNNISEHHNNSTITSTTTSSKLKAEKKVA